MMKIIINTQGSDFIVFTYYYKTLKNNRIRYFVLMVYTLMNLNFLNICVIFIDFCTFF